MTERDEIVDVENPDYVPDIGEVVHSMPINPQEILRQSAHEHWTKYIQNQGAADADVAATLNEETFVDGFLRGYDDAWHLAFQGGLTVARVLREQEARRGPPQPGELASEIIGRQHRQIQQITELVEQAARTDGGHHKQYFLAQIGLIIGVSLEDQGIAP